MRGSPAGHVLQLPFSYPHAGRAGDRGLRVLHRAACRLDGGEPPQPVGVLLLRQVQRRVRRVHIRPARRPVRDPRHADLPEPRHQRPGPAPLGAGTQPPAPPPRGAGPPGPAAGPRSATRGPARTSSSAAGPGPARRGYGPRRPPRPHHDAAPRPQPTRPAGPGTAAAAAPGPARPAAPPGQRAAAPPPPPTPASPPARRSTSRTPRTPRPGQARTLASGSFFFDPVVRQPGP